MHKILIVVSIVAWILFGNVSGKEKDRVICVKDKNRNGVPFILESREVRFTSDRSGVLVLSETSFTKNKSKIFSLKLYGLAAMIYEPALLDSLGKPLSMKPDGYMLDLICKKTANQWYVPDLKRGKK